MFIFLDKKNRNDRIWTCDPCDPNTVRYQTALHSDFFFMNLFYLPVSQFGFNWKRLRFTRLVRLHSDFFFMNLFYLPVSQFGFNWKRLRFTRLVCYIPIFSLSTYFIFLYRNLALIGNGSVSLTLCDYIPIFLYKLFRQKTSSNNSLTQTFKK